MFSHSSPPSTPPTDGSSVGGKLIGCGALVLYLLLSPLFVLAGVAGRLYSWGAVRLGRWPRSREVSLEGDMLVFYWSGVDEESRQALGAAVALLAEWLMEARVVPALDSLRFENPGTGFSLHESALEAAPAGEGTEKLAEWARQRLWGEAVEGGELWAEGEGERARLNGVDLDARHPLAGHLAVRVPEVGRLHRDRPELAARLAERYGYDLGVGW